MKKILLLISLSLTTSLVNAKKPTEKDFAFCSKVEAISGGIDKASQTKEIYEIFYDNGDSYLLQSTKEEKVYLEQARLAFSTNSKLCIRRGLNAEMEYVVLRN